MALHERILVSVFRRNYIDLLARVFRITDNYDSEPASSYLFNEWRNYSNAPQLPFCIDDHSPASNSQCVCMDESQGNVYLVRIQSTIWTYDKYGEDNFPGKGSLLSHLHGQEGSLRFKCLVHNIRNPWEFWVCTTSNNDVHEYALHYVPNFRKTTCRKVI